MCVLTRVVVFPVLDEAEILERGVLDECLRVPLKLRVCRECSYSDLRVFRGM